MTAAAKVLVIGGYGVFGGRLIQLLEDEPRLNLLVAGRSVDRASAFVRSRGNTAAELTPLAFDRNGDLAGYLAAIRPDIVVDASGPFKTYGADRYRVVQACVTQRVTISISPTDRISSPGSTRLSSTDGTHPPI
jgi:short subunit dehydrogenase-like uncharacterized protein